MQLSSIQSKLIWLLLPAVPGSCSLVTRGSTTIGTGVLNLMNTQSLSLDSKSPSAHCKDPNDPSPFVTSLNHTLPILPSVSDSFLESMGISPDGRSYPFDCVIDFPGGLVLIEVCPTLRRLDKETRQG